MGRISVAVVDDHILVRRTVQAFFEHDSEIFVEGAFSCGEDIIELVASTKFDLVILDMSMPGLNGVEVAQQLLKVQPEIKILFFTIDESRELMDKVLDCGAHGYIIKKAGHQQLSGAIKAIIHGGRYFSASALNSYINSFPEEQRPQREEPLRRTSRKG